MKFNLECSEHLVFKPFLVTNPFGTCWHWLATGTPVVHMVVTLINKNACVTVLGHLPLSHPVAWRWSSSPIGLVYRRYTSTNPLNPLQMAALRAAI